MSENTYASKNKSHTTLQEAIRKRTGMYIPGTDFWGFINYLVASFNLSLHPGASSVAFTVGDGDFTLESDTEFAIGELEDGSIMPFEGIVDTPWGHGFDAAILNAVSATLDVDAVTEDRHWQLSLREGKLISRSVQPTPAKPHLRLQFRPDPTIFTISGVPPVNIHSYLNRICHLNPGVEFSCTINGQTNHYHSQGMIGLFESISQPYQYLHKPIEVQAQDGDLEIDLACAFHSWSQSHIWTFINKGRAVDGGTHEEGLEEAIHELPSLLGMQHETGVLAVMAVRYPKATFEGCIKAKVYSPELRPRIKALVLEGFQNIQLRPNTWRRSRSSNSRTSGSPSGLPVSSNPAPGFTRRRCSRKLPPANRPSQDAHPTRAADPFRHCGRASRSLGLAAHGADGASAAEMRLRLASGPVPDPASGLLSGLREDLFLATLRSSR